MRLISSAAWCYFWQAWRQDCSGKRTSGVSFIDPYSGTRHRAILLSANPGASGLKLPLSPRQEVASRTRSHCPDDVEGYAIQHLLGRLSPDESHAFQQHISTCSQCTDIVNQTETIIQALRDATAKPGD
jgi:hypothetical protein